MTTVPSLSTSASGLEKLDNVAGKDANTDDTMKEDEISSSPNLQSEDHWHRFSVKWRTEFISNFGEICLPSSKTADFILCDEATPLNKARNWQEVPEDVGAQVISLIDEMYAGLVEKRREAEAAAEAAKPPPFISMKDVSVTEDVAAYWKKVVRKVERELGPVHLACPFGSQRYSNSVCIEST
jgi:hypothetical protein